MSREEAQERCADREEGGDVWPNHIMCLWHGLN